MQAEVGSGAAVFDSWRGLALGLSSLGLPGLTSLSPSLLGPHFALSPPGACYLLTYLCQVGDPKLPSSLSDPHTRASSGSMHGFLPIPLVHGDFQNFP